MSPCYSAIYLLYIGWLLLAGGDIEANPGPSHYEEHHPEVNPNPRFFEAQVNRNCQAHSLNNAAGKPWVKPEDLHNFWITWQKTLHDEGDKKAWHTARGDGGAFSDEVIHLYLRYKYGLTIKSVAQLRTTDDWNDDNFDTIAIEYATLNFLCKTNGHSMALRKLGGQWKLLDSDSSSKSAIAICELSHSYTNHFHEVFVIAPDPAATPAQTMATSRQGIRHIISHKEDNQTPPHCYMETQYKQCCLVHALNMAMGNPMIRPEDVITHCKALDTHIQELANQARQEQRLIPLRSSLPHIYEESGNFTISTINHYLYHHHKDLHLCPPTTTTYNNNITPELLTTLTGKTDSYTNTAAILITHNHATTIRHINNAWHWLDSERGHPRRLDTPEDWLQLHGMLVQIKKGDAADTNLIHPLCWLADPTRRATTEQLEQHLRTTHIDLTTQDLGTQPAHTPRTDRPLPTAQPASYKRILTATADTHPTDKQARPRLRQVAPTVTLPTLQDRSSSSKRPTSSGTIVDKKRTKPRAQTKDSHTQTLMYRYLNTAPTPPPAAIPTTPPPPTDNLRYPTEHPGPHPQHSTLPTRQPQPTHNRQHITLTTLNVRSLHRSRNDVLNLVHQHSPDILILTETMTQPRSNNPGSGWLKRVMPDYTTHRHRGHSEVLIGIKHNLAIQMQATMLSPSIDAEVNARCVILTLNQHQCEQLTIIATYWPSGSNGEALSLREKMQEHIRTATGHLPGSLILAGDINATMKTEDRSEHTEYTQDSMMRGFATEMQLKEADPGDRAWTYQQPHCNSRIDAILTRDARHGPEHRTHVDTNAYLSDHRPLTAALNTARLGIDLAAPHKPPKHSYTILTTPVTNKDREAYRLAVQQPSSGVPQLHAELTAFLAPIYTEATHHLATLDKTNPQQPQRLTSVAGRPAREAVDTAATMLTHLLQTCRTAALKTCNTKTLTRGGQHYQRRTMCRIRQALGKKLKTTRELSRKARVFFKQNNVHPTIDELVPETDTTNAETREAVQARQGEDPTENHVQAALARLTNSYRDQIHQLDDDDSALAIAQARARMQQLISTQPKKANKRILRPSRTDHKGLQALADPDTKTICTAPADLNRIITAAYGQKLSAPTPKTGHYITTQTRNYPWARAKADDAFALHACQNIHWLHTAIMDKAGFQECLSRLAGGKAPGPDGVENEIIKMLPWEIRDTIHQLFIIMWATGCTPTTWKTSDTCLLYKDKGQETDLNAYRPVGLANTVYKLWTSLITKTLSEYAEANGMLSKNQAGFRTHRNTTQQLQMLVMALEDAKLAKADIYALLVDFTSAFNTTCQDKLLWIMHDLGFPTDATDAVKDLYTGATTRFKTPYGHTDPVPVNRGTIQGDSLSPFLFLIYIEPLLRWLQVGARGYKFKSATADSGVRATVSSIDYADDIAILCNTLRNLRCQADKLSAFSDWGHLIISHSKTLATAALHHSVETGMCSNAAEADKRASQQLRTVSLQGKPVTYHRPTSPFTYLGVLITMTLDWKPQHTAMITQLRQKLERLRRSFASARQAIHIIRTAVIPSLAYSFCAVPCTPGDLELYDRSINQCVKLKLRLPLGTPNAIIREDAGKLGIGISSTAQEYHARNTTALTHSLQSTDAAHAHISRSMLHKQITWLSTQASTQGHRILTLLHHTLRARQLVYASISGLSATEEGLPLYHEECQTLGRLITQTSSSQAHDVVSASITCLKSLGITHASELSCKGNTHIITGNMLTSKYGKKVKQKHIIALNKLAAMAAQPSCPDATATRAIRDSRNTSLDLPPDQRKITPWAAGLTELAPTPAVPDTRARYMDMKAYAVMHATQPATADRAAAAVHEAIRTSSRLLKREQRATKSAPTKPNPPKAGTKRNNEGRQTQTIPQDIVRIVGLDLPGLSSWKVDKACRCKSKNLGCILGAMYGHQEAITSIDGWQWDGINKENYYKVHWKPTVIDRWALPLCAEEGYTPTHIETISREEAKDVCTCELCWLPRGDSPTCHNCKRAYHPACLDEAHLSGHKEPGYWLCPICKFGSNDFKTTMRQSAHSDLIRVHWHPTLEPAPLITAHLDYMAKRNDYDEENRQIQEARHARPDAHLPAHTRQGLPDPHTWLPRCNNLHSKATFHTYPINPQTDIVGTGNCETFLQLHPHMTAPAMSLSTGEPIMPRHDLVQHVTVHDESGRTVGLLTKDQHQHLHAWLQHTPHTRNLATEAVALLRRQDAQSSHHPMRGAQDKALNTLHTTRSFPSTVQRWADPLTVRPETTTYWSPDTNDTAFGAHHNCLLVRHTGLSTWNVPADDAVALKCINHAIHSATQEEAMATIMLIPGKKGISYPKHINTLRRYPEYCQHLASIPPTKTRCPKPGKHAKLHIYVIWNAAGQQLVTKGNPQGWLASTATALHPQRDTHPIRNRPTNQSQPATPPSGHKQHMRLPLDRDLPTSGHQRSHEQLTHHSTTQPRMAITEWATIAYTDGSCIKTSGAAPESVGAGVYIPENNVLITAALNDPESKTINRAELTAIHAALEAGAKRIATDSLCSLYQIRRALANPMSLITHRHNDILTAIATLIIDSPATIHFYKVRAHSGIIGNEGADALAKYAALHPELANTPAYSPTTRNETKNWLSNETDGESPAPLPDCRQSVRAHMHRKHKLGLANQDSIYYQMTQEITKAAAKGAGERVMIDTNISTHAQRTALLYRTGGLYNQKLAMRWKRATDDRCPLCGEADSATHLLSGCSETLPMVQERHNGAGRLITKAISKGTLGGYISFADTGSWEKGAKESLDLPSDTLHTTLQTLGLKPEDTKHTTRPDILMVLPHKKASKDGKDTKRVCIIEIKYCSDSRWTDQLNKALTQHTHLAETIRKEDHMVAIIPILLGIGGITYEAHTRQHLLTLGITQANTTKLLNKLTRHAMEAAHSIAKTSYRLRATKGGGGKPEQEELKRQIQDYLSKGMIEPSSSPYAAPILFVQKKSGELRMCIDYRQLNKLTLRDQYPLPRIDDLFDRLSGCSVFSSLDLQAGYHQIRITPEDVPKTAFRTPEGHFQFKVLSFGLTNAPATFQRVMNDAFAPMLGKCALVYLDDILVMSKSLPEHLQHLRLVFDLLRKNKLYAKMSKCEFMQLTLRFLGHVISAGAISVDPDKVRAIVDWPVPSSLTQLQSFLGAANFVRKFVHNFSAISAPLTDLCGKLSATFPWHSWPDHERLAFYELKAAVANVPMLRLPDHTQPFQVYCDASLQGVGAVLMQDGYPLAYLSKKLSSAEVNYTTGEQEMLALVTACKEWRCYLEGVPFTLFTDHKPLISLPTQKNLSRRQARWMELLSRFDFKLEYIPGPVNPADPLSRLITGLQESATVCAMLTRRRAQLSREGEGASVARALEANAPAAVTAKSSSTPEITENTTDTSHNRDFVPLVTCTSDTSVHYPAAPAHPLGLSDQLIQGYRLDPAFNAEADLSSMYQDTHGLWRLTSKDKVVVPNDSELRNHILHEMHDAVYSGHVGISKTLERVSRVFWWNTMRADVRYYVSTCDACQRDKASTLKPGGLLNPLSIPDYRWESVSMDFITKLPSGSHGYDAICVFVDRLSKMVHFVPCREDLKARRFAQLFIDHVYKLHGMPAELISDRGSLFTSVFWREVMRRCGSKPALSSSYHPQSDGQTERYNRVLEEMLRHYISPTQSDWPDYLALAEFAVNNSWQESIQSTPFLVNTGQSPVTVGLRDLPYGGRCPSAHAFTRWWQDVVANARKCMAAAQSRQAAYANKARRDVEYKVGQKVLLSTKNLKLQPGKARKLIPRYVGPFEILLLVGAVAVKLDLPASMSRLHPVFHVSLIKPYTGTDVGFMPPPVTWMDETPVYYVERLLDHKGVKDNKASYYLVQWEGYDSTHNTWEPRSNLTDCDKVLAEYNAIHHLK
ncbi:hypothetical protein QJQ45_001063 [Haematococcus lacustris]|nr:hypothetical protein QJQ45_001063 [Haematococcus lacustris]